MPDEPDRLPFSDDQLRALAGARGVLALTDDGKEEILAVVRDVAARLAADLSTTLFLADRSVRTWTETPHVREPAGVEELRNFGVTYMVEQMEAALALGAPDVRGLAPSIPTFDALLDSLEASQAEVIVAPSELEHLRFFDRLQVHGDIASEVKQRAGGRHVVIVTLDGSAELI